MRVLAHVWASLSVRWCWSSAVTGAKGVGLNDPPRSWQMSASPSTVCDSARAPHFLPHALESFHLCQYDRCKRGFCCNAFLCYEFSCLSFHMLLSHLYFSVNSYLWLLLIFLWSFWALSSWFVKAFCTLREFALFLHLFMNIFLSLICFPYRWAGVCSPMTKLLEFMCLVCFRS